VKQNRIQEAGNGTFAVGAGYVHALELPVRVTDGGEQIDCTVKPELDPRSFEIEQEVD
jgi:hypothetical protein